MSDHPPADPARPPEPPTATTAPRGRPLRRRLRGRAIAAAVPLLARLASLAGWRRAQRWGAALGSLAWSFGGRERRRTLEHLALAFPELDEARRRQRGRAAWRHLGRSLGEVLVLVHRGSDALEGRVEVVGAEHLEAQLAAGHGVLLLTAHCGNWELLGGVLGRLGVAAWAIVRGLEHDAIDRTVADFRARLGVRALPRGSAAASRALLTVLRTPRSVLVLLADQDFAGEGIVVPFFGHPAHTPVGPARLALRRGTVLMPVFDERRGDGSHLLTFHPPLELPDDVPGATAVMTAAIENQIRRAPEQWVWMHRRWRRGAPKSPGSS